MERGRASDDGELAVGERQLLYRSDVKLDRLAVLAGARPRALDHLRSQVEADRSLDLRSGLANEVAVVAGDVQETIGPATTRRPRAVRAGRARPRMSSTGRRRRPSGRTFAASLFLVDPRGCHEIPPHRSLLNAEYPRTRGGSVRPITADEAGGLRVEIYADELRPAVDVVARPRERRVGHEVNGERGDVGLVRRRARWQRRATPSRLASSSVVGEGRRRQRGVDEAGGDGIDANRGELDREGRRERRQHGGGPGEESEPGPDSAGRRVPPMNSSVPPGLILGVVLRATSSARDHVPLQRRRTMHPVLPSSRRRGTYSGLPAVIRTWSIGSGRPSKQPFQRGWIIHIEGRRAAPASDVERCPLEPFGIPPGEDDVGSLRAGSPGRLETRFRRCRRSGRRLPPRAVPARGESRRWLVQCSWFLRWVLRSRHGRATSSGAPARAR